MSASKPVEYWQELGWNRALMGNHRTGEAGLGTGETSFTLRFTQMVPVYMQWVFCFQIVSSSAVVWTLINNRHGDASGKEPASQCRRQEMRVRSLGRDLLEEGIAAHSSILAWRIPWTEEPGGLQSMGSHRVGHDWSDLACTCVLFYHCCLNCCFFYIYIYRFPCFSVSKSRFAWFS